MDAIARVLAALTALYRELGFWPTLILLIIIVAGPVVRSILRDRTLKKAYDEVVASKEQEIQRLATDNRAWREHFFAREGTSETRLLGEAATKEATPLTVVKPVTAQSKKKKGR